MFMTDFSDWPCPSYDKVRSILFRTRRTNFTRLLDMYPYFNPNEFVTKRNTYVHEACVRNDLVMLQALVKCGGSLLKKTLGTDYPIHLACMNVPKDNSNKLITWILSRADGLSTINYSSGIMNPLHIAAINRDFDLILLLLQYGANPTLCNRYNMTPKIIIQICGSDYCSRKELIISSFGLYHVSSQEY